jgi:hypothetical protein
LNDPIAQFSEARCIVLRSAVQQAVEGFGVLQHLMGVRVARNQSGQRETQRRWPPRTVCSVRIERRLQFIEPYRPQTIA